MLAGFLAAGLEAETSPACGPMAPPFHPVLNRGDRCVGELPLRGHAQGFVLVSNRLNEQARVDIAGDDRRTRVAPLPHPVQAVESQAPFERFGLRGVALVTMLDQDGTHLRFEEVDALQVGFPITGPCRSRRQNDQCQEARRLDRCAEPTRCPIRPVWHPIDRDSPGMHDSIPRRGVKHLFNIRAESPWWCQAVVGRTCKDATPNNAPIHYLKTGACPFRLGFVLQDYLCGEPACPLDKIVNF